MWERVNSSFVFIRGALSCVQEELCGTKDHASRIIKEQGTEITDCSQLLSQLADQMASILDGLKMKAGMQVCCYLHILNPFPHTANLKNMENT